MAKRGRLGNLTLTKRLRLSKSRKQIPYFLYFIFPYQDVFIGLPCRVAAPRASARLKFCPAEQAVKIDNLLVDY